MIRTFPIAILLLATATLAAAQALAGEECFCLRHGETDTFLRGCTEYKAPTDYWSTADCTDPITCERSEQRIWAGWT